MMASSDDESDVGPVSNYHFVDERDEPISFSVLPVQWGEDEIASGNKLHIFLHGTADNGLQKIYKRVVAWKFDLTNVTPEVYVLSKEKSWIKLQKPRKSFEEIIRTILITVHCLSYAKRNPEATEKSSWDHLSKIFSLYEVRPSQNDLVDHMDFVSEAFKRDDMLAKSKFLLKFLEEKPRKRRLSDEDLQSVIRSGFIVDDQDDLIDDAGDDESNEEEDLFDSVCSICDNGGSLLCCEGRCMRSFHATVEDGEESRCVSLGLTMDEVEAIQNFFCKNCEYKQHQCFICGKLGSSDKASGAEVFPCVSATCGRFYHPDCVSKWLLRGDEVAVEQLRKSIFAGECFTCPSHKCYVCKQGENKMDGDLQFAVCRRCPKAYHRKCLPRDIVFQGEEEEGVIARAWTDLLPNRILIYCLKHEIVEEMGTPIRDRVIFPGMELKKTIVQGLKRKQTSAIPATKEKFVSVKRTLNSKASSQGKLAVNVPKRCPSVLEEGESARKIEKLPGGSDPSSKIRSKDAPRKTVKENVRSVSLEVDRSCMVDVKRTSLAPVSEPQKSVTVKPAKKMLRSELPSLDAETERRLLSLMKDAASEVTLKDIQKKHKIPSTHSNSLKAVVDRAISMGKVEGSVEAVRTALKKLEEEGNSIEDAKAVCEPEVINQIFRWKSKLKVYLAPFFHAARYTSFGRHFTKMEKLQEVVDKLHWYAQDGDMIVDFCCGANDFSCLLKKKLEETGKTCLYKNFDILQAKNDFNFEKRDWMTVGPEELAPGSQLIMGLNPPFGVRASLANKFINKALEFNPKLLILIVPPETERLDKKKTPYDLVWEDDQFLTGKSFYLPGSVDENGKQMDQWNLIAPPLYLWSHRDWAAGHKAIAEKHGHISRQQEASDSERNCNETHNLDHPVEDGHGHDDDTSMATDVPLQNVHGEYVDTSMMADLRSENILGHTSTLADLPQNIEMEKPMQIATTYERRSPDKIIGGESNGSDGSGENQSKKTPRKRKRGKQKAGRGMSEKSPLDKQNVGRNLGSEKYKGIAQSPPANMIDGRSSMEGHPSKCDKIPSNVGCGEIDYYHFGDKRMPHCSPAHVIDSISPLEGHSSKSIEVPPHAGFCDDGYQHFGDKGMPYPSPLNMIDGVSSLEGHPSKSFDIPSHTGVGKSYRHFEPTNSDSHMQFGSAYRGNTLASFPDDMGWRYGMNNNDPYSTHRFRGGSNLGEQFQFYEQELVSSPPGYGQMGAFPSPTYGHLGSVPEASYRMNLSAMDRYRPRLDGSNHQSISALRSEPPMLPRTSFNDPRAPSHAGSPFGIGFASGPYQPGTRGWLDP
ncbi:protein ENHANCED DOWNY MILDEW 2-like isoform X1 [Pistacia vera]|uniref:protein ENHANCED DOWNY MILDEW 2-like isoform X1 n=1 Tax=Pistacia vera TaxID=55513 RepID=UPI0012634162|nr:protein ENHANCED DOWNY MILDEW 2-like isoform X1 [Pistacia vera]XP_031286416.1 protein ENHANCED DOWNY MILDEW 2-like isoform X2 [Pistacia vera]XP_031286417.1 protein ENHANCED DOWNY MILDEW 2-like isoform X1 [Pistacia vera]